VNFHVNNFVGADISHFSDDDQKCRDRQLLGRNDQDKRPVPWLFRLVSLTLRNFKNKFLNSEIAAESFDLTPQEENCSLLDISCSQIETVQDGKAIKDLVCDLYWKARLL
jgi:hypothetical protein